MSRRIWAGVAFVAAVLLVVLWSSTQTAEALAPVPPEQPKEPDVLTVINKPQKFDRLEGGDTTLEDVVEILTKKLDIAIDIDDQAFAAEGLQEVEKARVCDKPLPAMKNVTTANYLRKVLKRVPSESGATFWVRKNRLEITTFAVVKAKIWGADHPGPYYPLVNATFEKKALTEIAQELADAYEMNIVIDARAAEKAKTTLTVKFSNAPLDTVVKVLTDQADLQTVVLDNVMYVTTSERAAILKTRRDKERQQEDPNAPEGRRVGPGPGGMGPPASPMGVGAPPGMGGMGLLPLPPMR